MIHVRLRWCLLIAAMLLALPNVTHMLQRLASGQGFGSVNGPEGGWLWIPLVAIFPNMLSAIGTLQAEVRRNIRLLSPSITRDLYVAIILGVATISVLLIAWCQLIIHDTGSSGGFENLIFFLGWFAGWCAFGIVGVIDIIYVSVIARFNPASLTICRSCGYDLRGSPGAESKTCPECGHQNDAGRLDRCD